MGQLSPVAGGIPEHSVRKKGVFDVAKGFLDEKRFAVFKVGYVSIDVAEILGCIPEEHKGTFKAARTNLNLAKLCRAPGFLLNSVNKLRHSVVKLIDGWDAPGRGDKFYDCVRKANGCVAHIWEIADFLTKTILVASKDSVKTLKGFSSASLAFGMVCNIGSDHIPRYRSGKLGFVATFIRVAKDLSYTALGVFGTLSFLFGIIFSKPLLTALSVSTVVFMIIDYYRVNLGAEIKSQGAL